MIPYNKKLIPLAKHLRKNMPAPEILLWSKLRMKQIKGFQFYRQRPIGEYIVDFYAPYAELVIEVDGNSHYEGLNPARDIEKDKFLNDCGLKILRFTNQEIMDNIAGVVEMIESRIIY